MSTIFVIFLVFGWIVSMIYGQSSPALIFIIMIIAISISMIYLIVSYYNADKIAIASVNAKPASHIEHRMLHHAVDSMAIASGLPKPRVYVMESNQINAFASGRDPQHAVICVTTGLLKKLNKQELEGVIAHEMAHIANFDIRFMTLTAVMVGMIAIAAEIFLRSLWFSGGSRSDKQGVILLIIGIVLAILAPIAAHLVSLAISRKREYTADATGAKFTRHPAGLASALRAISGEHKPSSQEGHRYSKAMAPLFISDPFKKKVKGLFSTHPPVEERIKRLDAM